MNAPAGQAPGRQAPAAHALELRGLSKRYGGFTAVEGVSLTVERGRFLTLLGPSGSGKTTILMTVAGFVAPSAGAVLLDGRDIPALPMPRTRRGKATFSATVMCGKSA